MEKNKIKALLEMVIYSIIEIILDKIENRFPQEVEKQYPCLVN